MVEASAAGQHQLTERPIILDEQSGGERLASRAAQTGARCRPRCRGPTWSPTRHSDLPAPSLAALLLLMVEQFMGNVQPREYGDAFQSATPVAVAQFAQLAIEIGRCRNQAAAFFRLAGDQVFAIEDTYGNRFAHA